MQQTSTLHDVCIATARINGLNKLPYYFKERGFYAVDIKFTDSSTLLFDQVPFINIGNTREEAKTIWSLLKKNFSDAHIHNEDKVAVIFNMFYQVVAIGNIGNDVWIDVINGFSKKSFRELNITITSLKVY